MKEECAASRSLSDDEDHDFKVTASCSFIAMPEVR